MYLQMEEQSSEAVEVEASYAGLDDVGAVGLESTGGKSWHDGGTQGVEESSAIDVRVDGKEAFALSVAGARPWAYGDESNEKQSQQQSLGQELLLKNAHASSNHTSVTQALQAPLI